MEFKLVKREEIPTLPRKWADILRSLDDENAAVLELSSVEEVEKVRGFLYNSSIYIRVPIHTRSSRRNGSFDLFVWKRGGDE